jgi:hypothetical protein
MIYLAYADKALQAPSRREAQRQGLRWVRQKGHEVTARYQPYPMVSNPSQAQNGRLATVPLSVLSVGVIEHDADNSTRLADD